MEEEVSVSVVVGSDSNMEEEVSVLVVVESGSSMEEVVSALVVEESGSNKEEEVNASVVVESDNNMEEEQAFKALCMVTFYVISYLLVLPWDHGCHNELHISYFSLSINRSWRLKA
ncbi:hypothetical protein GmHk_02G003727 [Glycine max]|nr:hypothetical protein GmHk_02G003727 [Glycine max]